jgi:hypothetical protein
MFYFVEHHSDESCFHFFRQLWLEKIVPVLRNWPNSNEKSENAAFYVLTYLRSVFANGSMKSSHEQSKREKNL